MSRVTASSINKRRSDSYHTHLSFWMKISTDGSSVTKIEFYSISWNQIYSITGGEWTSIVKTDFFWQFLKYRFSEKVKERIDPWVFASYFSFLFAKREEKLNSRFNDFSDLFFFRIGEIDWSVFAEFTNLFCNWASFFQCDLVFKNFQAEVGDFSPKATQCF